MKENVNKQYCTLFQYVVQSHSLGKHSYSFILFKLNRVNKLWFVYMSAFLNPGVQVNVFKHYFGCLYQCAFGRDIYLNC